MNNLEENRIIQILTILKNSGKIGFEHDFYEGIEVYVDQHDYDYEDIREWYFSISYEGVMVKSNRIREENQEFLEHTNLLAWFDVIISKLENALPPEKVELTMDEIAEKFNINVKNLTIKKD